MLLFQSDTKSLWIIDKQMDLSIIEKWLLNKGNSCEYRLEIQENGIDNNWCCDILNKCDHIVFEKIKDKNKLIELLKLIRVPKLTINNCGLTDEDIKLDVFQHCKFLDLSNNLITNADVLFSNDDENRFKTIRLNNNKITSCSIKLLKSNLSVDLSHNSMSKFELNCDGAGYLSKIANLNISNNNLVNLENISCFMRIKSINVSHNLLNCIDSLFPSMYLYGEINASNCQITKCNFSSSVVNNYQFCDLKYFDVSYNKIQDINFAKSRVTNINLSHNQFHDLKWFKTLGINCNYMNIDISDNQITHVDLNKSFVYVEKSKMRSQVKVLHRIESLDLFSNPIKSYVAFLKDLFTDYMNSKPTVYFDLNLIKVKSSNGYWTKLFALIILLIILFILL